MKWGELIILWVGGLLSIMTLIANWPSHVDVRVYGPGIVMATVAQRVGLVLAIWIICGLVWVSLYKRSRTKKPRPTEQTIPTEKANGENEIQMNVASSQNLQEERPLTMSEEGYGYKELRRMKRQFMGLLGFWAALWAAFMVIAVIAILAAKFLC
jgi:hypothetical protein